MNQATDTQIDSKPQITNQKNTKEAILKLRNKPDKAAQDMQK